MTAILAGLIGLIVLVMALPVGVLLLQVLAACLPAARRSVPTAAAPRPTIAVLMPAHNEALGIRATLAHITPQLQAGDRLVVVADNCSDDTATIARACGAEVLERTNATLRGKGYALDHGVRHIAADPRPVVVLVDADCVVHPGALERVARDCQASQRPVQALYLMELPGDGRAVSPLAVFAWRLRNLVRPLGWHRLGLPCHLMGSGMAVPWSQLKDLPLASGHIVEDMQMGVDLARRGAPPLFCPEALVTSTFPVSQEGAQSQRTRWEHGTLGMLLFTAPRMVLEALGGRGKGLLPLALDIFVPPLALLALLLMLTNALAFLGLAVGTPPVWAGLALAEMASFVLAVGLAWGCFARHMLPLSQLPAFAGYVFSKVPLYLRFLVRRQVEWVRAKRDAD